MKRKVIYKVRKAVRTAFLLLVAVIALMALFIGAVLQESYRNCPPTDAEIAENPHLIVYRGE